MLMTLERFRYQKKKILVFKPKIDTRYSDDHVVSHSGWKVPATIVASGTDVLETLRLMDEPPDVVAIDEAFMIDGIGEVLIWLYRNLGITIIVSSLDMSYACRPFEEVKRLLPWATHVEKCAAVCVVCGEDAFYTHKKADDLDEIKVGGSETYEPRCFEHHLDANLLHLPFDDDKSP